MNHRNLGWIPACAGMTLKAIIPSLILVLSGCSSWSKYPPGEFSSANKVVTQTVKVPALPDTQVEASFGYGNDPALVKAYQEFVKTGKAPNVYTEGFVSFPYEPNQQPIVACQPLRACIIQLQAGEKINQNGVVLGDSSRWQVSEIYTGDQFPNGAFSLVIKPEDYDISTNLIMATNKRTYDLSLVSINPSEANSACTGDLNSPGCQQTKTYDRKVTFYYPYDTLAKNLYQDQQSMINSSSSNDQNSQVVDSSTTMDLNHINFNYKLSGSAPWKPVRVFDDGTHTFIQFPGIVSRMDLPAIFISKGAEKQLVNFRYKAPYYVVDALFEKAVLVSNVGFSQDRVFITNENLS